MDLREGSRTVGRRTVALAVLGGVAAGVAAVARGDRATPSGDLSYPTTPTQRTALSEGAASEPSPSSVPTRSPSSSPSATPPSSPSTTPASSPTAGPAQLPRGGRTLFPTYRLVGFSGGPGAIAFGQLGVGDLDDRVRQIEAVGAQYVGPVPAQGADAAGAPANGRRLMPVLELIAVVAQRFPGDDGRYRVRVEPSVIQGYLAAARRHQAMLLLNVQPGRARFLDEVRALERWLLEPDVGVALDPEWAVRAPAVPGAVFGQTTGAELNAVTAYLSGLVTRANLPEKAMVVHQLAPQVLRGLSALHPHPGVVVVKSVDGIGSPAAKTTTWRELVADLPRGVRPGFKLFFAEDTAAGAPLMTAADVLALRPVPDYVLYE